MRPDPDLPPFLQNAAPEHAQPDLESSSERYAQRFAGPVGAWFLEVQGRAVIELLAPLGGALRILDVGGGHAQLVPYLLAAGHKVVVVGSARSCSQRLHFWLQSGSCRFEVAPLTALPYESGAFDVVVSFRILSHLENWPALVVELCRVARRSVLLDYPALYSSNLLSRALFPLKLKIEGDTRTFRTFRPSEIDAAFRGAGFHVAANRRQYLLPMALHRLMGSAFLSRVVEGCVRPLGLTRLLGSPVIVRADRTAPRGIEVSGAAAG